MSASDKYYMIGEVMELTGATREMLRNYIKKGLINPIKAGNNYSLFSDEDVRNVVKIKVLDELGLDTKSAKAVTVSRSEMREALIKNNYDLSKTIDDQPKEVWKIIKKLFEKMLLSYVLKHSIVFNSDRLDNSNLQQYTHNINQNVDISQKYVDAIINTMSEYLVWKIGKKHDAIDYKVDSLILNEESNDLEEKQFIISFINIDNENEIIPYIKALKNGDLNETEELIKAKNKFEGKIIETYEKINCRYRLIPEYMIPEILSVIFPHLLTLLTSDQELKDQIELIDYAIKILYDDDTLDTYKIVEIISDRARQNYEQLKNNSICDDDKSPLYRFFEKINTDGGDKE